MAGRNGIRIGVALGDREAVGMVLGKKDGPVHRVPVSLGEGGDDARVDLLGAFRELRGGLEGAAGASTAGALVHVALLPPLADARVISLPPMRKAEVEVVLGRDVARHFLGATRPRVVGVRPPRRNGEGRRPKGDGSALPVLAGAASLAFLESVRTAVEEAGWRVGSFSAAHGAWLQAATSGRGSPPGAVVSVVGDTAHVLRLEGTDVLAVRQLPAGDPADVADATGPGNGGILVLAGSAHFQKLNETLARAGRAAFRDPAGWPGVEEATAARAGARVLELVPPTLAGERRARGKKSVLAMFGGALVLVLASIAAQLWGAHRELGSLRAQRASIAGEVGPLLAARDSLNRMLTQVQSMEDLARTRPVWTRSLVELTASLPEDTYLTGFFGSGDMVELEAAGSQAGEAIQALREAGLFEEVRLQGFVERELDEGETVVERFRLWVRLPQGRGEGGGS